MSMNNSSLFTLSDKKNETNLQSAISRVKEDFMTTLKDTHFGVVSYLVLCEKEGC